MTAGNDPNAEKRRSNILRSRELKRRTSARAGRSGSRGAGGSRQNNRESVFERLAQAAQRKNDEKAPQRAGGAKGSNALVKVSLEGNIGMGTEPMLAIDPAYGHAQQD